MRGGCRRFDFDSSTRVLIRFHLYIMQCNSQSSFPGSNETCTFTGSHHLIGTSIGKTVCHVADARAGVYSFGNASISSPDGWTIRGECGCQGSV